MKLNNKGFTLIEVLAVVVILSILLAIATPTVNHLINQNKENNYNNLEDSIIQAAKIYLSDNRYNIKIEGLCSDTDTEKNITYINNNELTNSHLPISWLVNSEDLSTDTEGNIVDPRNTDKKLNLESSYVLVKYQCSTKDYKYSLETDSLIWE